jgi:hypothetical protein
MSLHLLRINVVARSTMRRPQHEGQNPFADVVALLYAVSNEG